MKVMLIGQNNPLSMRPGFALYPAPNGCTGHRLWTMLHARTGVSRLRYIEAFDRRNLVHGMIYDRATAHAAADAIYQEVWGSGRTIVLLGEEVRKAFGHPRLLVHPQVIGGCTWRQIPHPSGRNPFYNEPKNRKVVELLLEELYVAFTKEELTNV